MNRLIPSLGIALALTAAGFCWCTGVWSFLFLAADLWMPDHAGVFMDGGRIVTAGVLRNPGGTEVFASATRFAAVLVLAASTLIGISAVGAARTLQRACFSR